MLFSVADFCIEHLCQNGTTCVSLQAGYTCTCSPGWTGTYCESPHGENFKAFLDIWGSGAYRLLDVSDHCLVTTGLFMIHDVDSKSTKRDSLYINNSLTLLRRKTEFPMTRAKRNFRNQTFICLMKCSPSSLKCS